MNTTVYPIPAAEASIEPLLKPFLEEDVEPNALEPKDQFTVLLIGETPAREQETVDQIIEESSERIKAASELNQLSTATLDERRLNTFATSLLYNLLSLDQTTDLKNTISRNDIPDEDVRKIDYYLPKINKYAEFVIDEQENSFNETVEDVFPVKLDDQATSELYEVLADRLAASRNARIDYLLLARVASSKPDRIRSLVKAIRDRDLDTNTYLGSSSGGYTRIMGRIYNLQNNDFTSEFGTGIDKIEIADQLKLRSFLQRLDSGSNPEDIYSVTPPLEPIVIDRYDSTSAEIAELLIRTVNCARVVHDSKSEIGNEYDKQRDALEDTVDDIESIYDELDELSEKYPVGKVQYDNSIVGDLREVIRQANRIDDPVAKFVLGYNRKSRDSLFSTFEENLTNIKQKLSSRKEQLKNQTQSIDRLESRLSTNIEDLNDAYETIETSEVEIDVPEKTELEDEIKEKGQNVITDLRESLTAIDFSNQAEDIRETQSDWEANIAEARTDLQSTLDVVEELTDFAEEVSRLQSVREERRDQLREIRETMEEGQ